MAKFSEVDLVWGSTVSCPLQTMQMHRAPQAPGGPQATALVAKYFSTTKCNSNFDQVVFALYMLKGTYGDCWEVSPIYLQKLLYQSINLLTDSVLMYLSTFVSLICRYHSNVCKFLHLYDHRERIFYLIIINHFLQSTWQPSSSWFLSCFYLQFQKPTGMHCYKSSKGLKSLHGNITGTPKIISHRAPKSQETALVWGSW